MNWRFQVGALQDVRSELSKLRGVLFHKVVEDLHLHLYNKGEYRYVELLDHLFLN
jgi:exocyst complex component 4